MNKALSVQKQIRTTTETLVVVCAGAVVAWYLLTPPFYSLLPFADPAHPIGIASGVAKVLFYVLVPALLVALLVPTTRASLSSFLSFYGLGGFGRRATLYSLAALIAGGATLLVYRFLPGSAPIVSYWPSRLFALIVGAGFAEEFLFRGYMQKRLTEAMNPWGAWLITSLVFGAIHILSALVGSGAQTITSALLVTFLAGPLLAYQYMTLRSRDVENIIPMMCFHGMLDIFTLVGPGENSWVVLPLSLFFYFTLTRQVFKRWSSHG